MQAGFKDRMRSCGAGLYLNLLHLYFWDARENDEGVGRYWMYGPKIEEKVLAVHTQEGICVWTFR